MLTMRERALQSGNGTYSADDRAAIQREVSALSTELDRIANPTSFGGQKLLDGSFGNRALQVGSEAGETISVTLNSTKASDLKTKVHSVTMAASDVTSGTATTAATNALTISAGGILGCCPGPAKRALFEHKSRGPGREIWGDLAEGL